MAYLLEFYCLLKYESSQDLSNAILNNSLVNLTGELGKWIPGDLMQEHYNRWLEDMIRKKGGDFDNKFYRTTLAPNIHHFLRIKEEIESSFDLTARGKTHGSPHTRHKYQQLLWLYKENQLHFFCSRRSMGHAAVNTFARGFNRLHSSWMATFVKQTTEYADIMKAVRTAHASHTNPATSTANTESSATSATSAEHPVLESTSAAPTSFAMSLPPSANNDHAEDNEVNPDIDSDPDSDEDHSGAHLVSGSSRAMFLDDATGKLVVDWNESEDEYDVVDVDEVEADQSDFNEVQATSASGEDTF